MVCCYIYWTLHSTYQYVFFNTVANVSSSSTDYNWLLNRTSSRQIAQDLARSGISYKLHKQNVNILQKQSDKWKDKLSGQLEDKL